jgi:MotA/TolQ/ExbB proton channel family
MFGRRRPATLSASADTLFWAWALHAGVMLFLAWWMHRMGLWLELVRGDPSGISVGIVALSVICTVWIGRRARLLAHESRPDASQWRAAWQADVAAGRGEAAALLSERTHGPHETAWWFASAAIKLGLLGTVVGFIVMSMQISRMQLFDISEVQNLLKQMTLGMAIALYTTLVGLAANLWLGLQLLLLDRMADKVAASILGGGDGAVV